MRHIALLITLLSTLAPTAAATQEQAVPANPIEVTLLPGDLIRVAIWLEEDLSGEFPVDETGAVTLPLLGVRQVTGIPMAELRQRLVAEYKEYLRNPSISVTPLRRVNVLGEVNTPGVYNLDPTMSLATALALAGGTTRDADLERLQVVRADGSVHTGIASQTTLHTVGIRSGDQIVVESRPERGISRLVVSTVATSLASALSVFLLSMVF